ARFQARYLLASAIPALAPGFAVGRDDSDTPRGNLRLARQCLSFRPHLRNVCPLRFDLAAQYSEPCLDVHGRGQRCKRLLRFVASSRCFLAARGEPRVGLRERGTTRRVTARGTLGFGMAIACGQRLLLEVAAEGARDPFFVCP